MNTYLLGKVLVISLAFLFCALPTHATTLWAASSIMLCLLFVSRIPRTQWKMLYLLVPPIITVALLQTITALINGSNFNHVFITAFKILCTGCIIICARFYIGKEALKCLAHALPKTAGMFLLIFARTIYTLLRLNKMIVYQLSSRLTLKSKEKYYIPKYYSIAMLYNQFRAMHAYRNGLLSRSIDSFPEPEIFTEDSSAEHAIVTAIIIIVALNIIIGT